MLLSDAPANGSITGKFDPILRPSGVSSSIAISPPAASRLGFLYAGLTDGPDILRQVWAFSFDLHQFALLSSWANTEPTSGSPAIPHSVYDSVGGATASRLYSISGSSGASVSTAGYSWEITCPAGYELAGGATTALCSFLAFVPVFSPVDQPQAVATPSGPTAAPSAAPSAVVSPATPPSSAGVPSSSPTTSPKAAPAPVALAPTASPTISVYLVGNSTPSAAVVNAVCSGVSSALNLSSSDVNCTLSGSKRSAAATYTVLVTFTTASGVTAANSFQSSTVVATAVQNSVSSSVNGAAGNGAYSVTVPQSPPVAAAPSGASSPPEPIAAAPTRPTAPKSAGSSSPTGTPSSAEPTLSPGAIAGIVVACVVAFGVVGFVAFMAAYRARRFKPHLAGSGRSSSSGSYPNYISSSRPSSPRTTNLSSSSTSEQSDDSDDALSDAGEGNDDDSDNDDDQSSVATGSQQLSSSSSSSDDDDDDEADPVKGQKEELASETDSSAESS